MEQMSKVSILVILPIVLNAIALPVFGVSMDTYSATEHGVWGVSYLRETAIEFPQKTFSEFKNQLIQSAVKKAIYNQFMPQNQQALLVKSSVNDGSVTVDVIGASSFMFSVNKADFTYKPSGSNLAVSVNVTFSIKGIDETKSLKQLESDVHLAAQNKRQWTPINGRIQAERSDHILGTPNSLFVLDGNNLASEPYDYNSSYIDEFVSYWQLRFKVMLLSAYAEKGLVYDPKWDGYMLAQLDTAVVGIERSFSDVLSHNRGQKIIYPYDYFKKHLNQFVFVFSARKRWYDYSELADFRVDSQDANGVTVNIKDKL
ncbi:hypothetical protein [Shewanella glacialipiscicola]|uniref:hypothetical protein n=1 Tax=Shewanella glacialipiscicola TaxID=614069 RepID=UPI003D7A67D7